MSLLHINMVTMFFACLTMLVGFSNRDAGWGPGLMLAGISVVLGLIVYDIRVLSL